MLDNLESITIQRQNTDFPSHFHDTFCISLLHQGMELIQVNGQEYYSEQGSITITNPYEIHSSPMIDGAEKLSFQTLYIPNGLMKYFLGGKNITFINRKIIDASANALFVEIVNALNSGDVKSTEKFLSQFINIIKQYAQDKKGEYSEISFSSLESVKSYIDHNLEEKINLEELASIANINKYGFAKKFKFSVGMSPMNYVLMKKIFSSKKTITNYSNLTNIAFDYNFTDMAHFSKTFKRFVGLSPKIYQKSLF